MGCVDYAPQKASRGCGPLLGTPVAVAERPCWPLINTQRTYVSKGLSWAGCGKDGGNRCQLPRASTLHNESITKPVHPSRPTIHSASYLNALLPPCPPQGSPHSPGTVDAPVKDGRGMTLMCLNARGSLLFLLIYSLNQNTLNVHVG